MDKKLGKQTNFFFKQNFVSHNSGDKTTFGLLAYLCSILLNERGVRVWGDVVVLDFWCGFAEIFILICRTVVLQNQVVCDI